MSTRQTTTQTGMNRIHVLSLLAVIGLISIFGAASCLPYGLEQFKAIKKAQLRRQIKNWQDSGRPLGYGYTNENEKCYLVARIFSNSFTNTTLVMALESSVFQRRGLLLGAENGEVYWLNQRDSSFTKID
jgi:hypothetical protein